MDERASVQRKERHQMTKPWADVLVAVLVAATEAILELVKIIRKKGKRA